MVGPEDLTLIDNWLNC